MFMVNQLVGFGAGQGSLQAILASTNTDTSDLSTYTWNSQFLGNGAAGDLWVIFAGAGGTSGSPQINSMTIGGVSATVRNRQDAGNLQLEAWTAVATGANSGTVTFTWSAGRTRAFFMLYRVSGFATGYNSAGGDSTGALSQSVNVPANSILLAAARETTEATTLTWTGVDKEFEVEVESGLHSCGKRAFAAANATHTLSVAFDVSPAQAAMCYVTVL